MILIYAVLVFDLQMFPNVGSEFVNKSCGCQVGKSVGTAVTANRRASWLGKTSM